MLAAEQKVLSGMLAVKKPAGITSKDVSRKLTRILGKLKLGHVGTLDPLAEGVLPILVGNSTRLQDNLLDSKKVYICKLKLGFETDTLDATGKTLATKEFKHVTLEQLRHEAIKLIGPQVQPPPLYSAVKFKGKPLYKYARTGNVGALDTSLIKRNIHVYSFLISSYHDGVVTFEVTVSKGTYVRSLAVSLAESVNTLGTVIFLNRIETAGVKAVQAVELATLISKLQMGEKLEDFIIPPEKFNMNIPFYQLKDDLLVEDLLLGKKIYFSQKEFTNKLVLTNTYKPDSFMDELECLLLDGSGKTFGLGLLTGVTGTSICVSRKRRIR
ncbi:MAG: tRNA pseudouridine(55) synthase TruB [Zetaproteobacteria bacterium]|nr:tRNA pseudouridine(55) synthase TruB [Pseudobdellovibrionaceae bacterium]|tara:strand:- start:1185 stop:2165 length:981 start_codon:yes stop_codon:yes gene_type:complete